MADQKISQLTALTTADAADVYAIVDTSATETKKISQEDLEDTIANSTNFVDELIANSYFLSELATSSEFIDNLVGNNYFTTELANNANFISTLTSNTSFQNAVNNFISSSSSSGGGGKPMTFALTDFDSSTANPLNGYSDREALVYSNGTTLIFQDILGYTQSRDVTLEWAAATEVFGYVVLDSFIYVLLSSGADLRVYRYSSTDLAAGGTIMTIATQALVWGASVVMTSNGTDFFFNYDAGSSANSYDIAKYTLSGTTLTYSATVAAGSTALQFAGKLAVDSSGNYYGTNGGILYQYDTSGTISFTSGVTLATISNLFNWGNTIYGSDNGAPVFTKLYLPDTDMSGLGAGSKKVGVGETSDIEWFNIQLPFSMANSAEPEVNVWTITGVTSVNPSILDFGNGDSVVNSSDQNGILPDTDNTGSDCQYQFDSNTQAIFQCVVFTDATDGANTGGVGFVAVGQNIAAYQGTNTLSVGFVRSAAGAWYARCATGAAFTETAVSISDSAKHVLRVEYDPDNSTPQARFYVDGTLSATITTNVPSAVDTKVGWSAANNAANSAIDYVTCPSFAVEI